MQPNQAPFEEAMENPSDEAQQSEMPSMTQQERIAYAEQMRYARERSNQRMTAVFLSVLIMLFAATILLRWSLFRVKNIAVIGLENVPYQAVVDTVARGGLKVGTNMPSISKEMVQRAVDDNYRLIFEDLLLDYRTKTAVLVVRERKSLAVVEALGTLYTVSEDGYVMDVYEGSGMQVPKAKGLLVQSAYPGRKLINVNEGLHSLRLVLYELEKQKVLNQITEIRLSDLSDISLYTKENRTVRLGDSSEMMKKITAMRTVENFLWRVSGFGGETIDVSNPESVTVQYPQT